MAGENHNQDVAAHGTWLGRSNVFVCILSVVVLVLVLDSRHLPAKDSSLKLSALEALLSCQTRLSSIVSGISDGNPPDYDYIPQKQLRLAICVWYNTGSYYPSISRECEAPLMYMEGYIIYEIELYAV